MRLRHQDTLHGWQVFVLLSWEESSLGAYQSHLHRVVAVQDILRHDTVHRVVEQTVLECTRLGKSVSTIKGVINAATMVVELRLADVVIEPTI